MQLFKYCRAERNKWLWLRIKFVYNLKNQTKLNLDLGKRSLAPLPLKLDLKLSLYKNMGLVLIPALPPENRIFFLWLPLVLRNRHVLVGSALLDSARNPPLPCHRPGSRGVVVVGPCCVKLAGSGWRWQGQPLMAVPACCPVQCCHGG